MKIQESGEMYLETILVLKQKMANVRAIDVAQEMNFSKPSVSRALGILKANDYITVDKNGYITLTKSGNDIAVKIYERHNVLTKLFVYIGVEKDVAAEDACKVEHDISDGTFAAIKKYFEQIEKRS